MEVREEGMEVQEETVYCKKVMKMKVRRKFVYPTFSWASSPSPNMFINFKNL